MLLWKHIASSCRIRSSKVKEERLIRSKQTSPGNQVELDKARVTAVWGMGRGNFFFLITFTCGLVTPPGSCLSVKTACLISPVFLLHDFCLTEYDL